MLVRLTGQVNPLCAGFFSFLRLRDSEALQLRARQGFQELLEGRVLSEIPEQGLKDG